MNGFSNRATGAWPIWICWPRARQATPVCRRRYVEPTWGISTTLSLTGIWPGSRISLEGWRGTAGYLTGPCRLFPPHEEATSVATQEDDTMSVVDRTSSEFRSYLELYERA